MKPVVEYTNYRKYILDYYTEQKNSSGFTWRQFAKVAGFASGSYLKLVCDGKTRLTQDGAAKTASAMGIVGFEKEYFLLMVSYNDAKELKKKKEYFEKMIALASNHKVRIAGGEFFSYFESWKNPVLRELVPAMPNASFEEIAARCYPKISATEVEKSIAYLVEQGLLTLDDEGFYHLTDRTISTGNMDVAPDAVHMMQQQMAELAIDALNNLPISERNFSGLTLGVAKGAYQKILNEMDKFRKRVIAIATADESTDQVFRLNLQLFPLTKPVDENAQEKSERMEEK